MARVGYIFDPSDHPAAADGAVRARLDAFFEHLFPAGEKGQPHAGYAILAHSPQLALGIGLVAYLASDEAAYVTGSAHDIDGGWTA